MPKHIVRLIFVILACAAAALYAKSYFTVGSFYRFGHYRADSVPEIAARATVFQTAGACVSCHSLRHAEWAGNAHNSVICEVCHGAVQGHPSTQSKVSIPVATVRLCTQCHEAMAGRPSAVIKQITVAAHPPGPDCIACHNPHAPKIGATVQATADVRAGHDGSTTCAACHGADGISPNPDWPNLAGQNAAYLSRQLAAFKVGARRSDLMSPIIQPLQDSEVRNLAAYFSTLKCDARPAQSAAPPPAIADLAKTCDGCHGEFGRGATNTSLPKLAGQNPRYVVAAIKAFRSGERVSPMMSEVAAKLADGDISGIATYFAEQSCRSDLHRGSAQP